MHKRIYMIFFVASLRNGSLMHSLISVNAPNEFYSILFLTFEMQKNRDQHIVEC